MRTHAFWIDLLDRRVANARTLELISAISLASWTGVSRKALAPTAQSARSTKAVFIFRKY